jgi:ABC-type multidrug transport system ATPase subunit
LLNDHSRHNAISVAFEDVRAYGFSQRSGYQKTVASFMTAYVQRAWNTIRRVPESRIDILKGIEAIVEPGEMVLVLGRPGSGCSTLLKTLAGQTHGFNVDSGSKFNFQGNAICQ